MASTVYHEMQGFVGGFRDLSDDSEADRQVLDAIGLFNPDRVKHEKIRREGEKITKALLEQYAGCIVDIADHLMFRFNFRPEASNTYTASKAVFDLYENIVQKATSHSLFGRVSKYAAPKTIARLTYEKTGQDLGTSVAVNLARVYAYLGFVLSKSFEHDFEKPGVLEEPISQANL